MRLLTLEIITPELKETYKIKNISLYDKVGSLGVYPGHIKFITTLPRSVGHFIDHNDRKYIFAYDSGILMVENNRVSITTRIFLKGSSADELKRRLEKKLERIDIHEKRLRENIKVFERFLLKKCAEIGRG